MEVRAREVEKNPEKLGYDDFLVAIIDGEWVEVKPFYDGFITNEWAGTIYSISEIDVLLKLPKVSEVYDTEATE